ncbi:MAG: winged helix-turn-helix transcriptional regulator [Thermoplasmatales archaeon]|nr:winged helix-turn-helix transcriptional regulator [Thermoplasmatales archaeon]MCK5636613.1 winged helix-turn-helix transcriptional regulator [Thermoplasmatales archaeon]
MHVHRRLLLGLALLIICLFFFVETATAESIKPDFTTIGISIAVVIAAIATIIAFITAGGVKYVTPENVLNTEVRKSLYEYIDEYPGSHLREIARELDLKPSNAAWHLRKLEQTNLVRSRNIGGKRVYYLVEGGADARKEAIAESVLRNKNARIIMHYLQDNPGKHLLEIAHALNLNHHTVKWHIKKMYMAELIDGDTSHSVYPVYYPTDIGTHAIRNFSDHLKKPGRAA